MKSQRKHLVSLFHLPEYGRFLSRNEILYNGMNIQIIFFSLSNNKHLNFEHTGTRNDKLGFILPL
jgi:hypothetical protein